MSPPTIRVLLVEDNPDDVLLIRRALAGARSTEFDVDHVDRLSEAQRRLAEDPFDVILLDLHLHDSRGLDTVVGARDGARGVPIVVLTSLDDEDVGVKAVQAGAQDYLVKGQLETPLLVRALRYAIERLRRDQAEALRKSQTTHLWRSLFRTLGRGASSVLYLAGVDAGAGTFEFVRDTWKPRDEQGFLKAVKDYLQSAGLCDIQEFRIDRAATRFTARVKDSFESVARDRPTDVPVCHFLRGILCGVATGLLGVSELICDEVTCQAHGAKECEFLVHPLFG